MKRKEIDRALEQLLKRIDGELAEVRDGLIEVDHAAAIRDRLLHDRVTELEVQERGRLSKWLSGDDDYSRKVPS